MTWMCTAVNANFGLSIKCGLGKKAYMNIPENSIKIDGMTSRNTLLSQNNSTVKKREAFL